MIAVMTLLVPAFWIAGVLVGFLFLILGLRGKTVGDAPHCRRCRFDLSGSAGGGRCPECGADLGDPRAIRIGLLRRNWPTAFAGAVFLLCGAGGLLALASGQSWTNLAPTAWLVHVEYPWSDLTRREEISAELTARIAKGAIGVVAAEPIVRRVLSEQARLAREAEAGGGSASFGVDARGLELALEAAAAGLLTPQELDAFILNSVDADLVFDPPLKAGEVRPRLVVQTTRGLLAGSPPPPFGTPSIDIEITSIVIAGKEIYGRGASSSMTALTPGSATFGPTALSTALPGGRHEARVSAVLRRGASERAVSGGAVAEVLARDRVLPRARIEAALRSALSDPTIEAIADPSGSGRILRVELECTRGIVEVTDEARLILVDDAGRERAVPRSQTSWRSRDGTKAVLTWWFNLPADASAARGPARLRVDSVRIAPTSGSEFEGFVGWLPLEDAPIDIELPPLPALGAGDSAEP